MWETGKFLKHSRRWRLGVWKYVMGVWQNQQVNFTLCRQIIVFWCPKWLLNGYIHQIPLFFNNNVLVWYLNYKILIGIPLFHFNQSRFLNFDYALVHCFQIHSIVKFSYSFAFHNYVGNSKSGNDEFCIGLTSETKKRHLKLFTINKMRILCCIVIDDKHAEAKQ